MANNESKTLVNAFIGAVVTIVLSFLPFSPLIGGAVAGYLEERDGIRVGALSGAIAALPLLGIAFLVIVGFGLFGAFLDFGIGILVIVFSFFVLSIIVVYTVGLSALGGYVGVYFVDEI